MRKSRRVVITGIGIVSSIGIGKDAFWKNLVRGKSGVTRISSLDTSPYKCHYGGEVKKFNPADFIPKRRIKFMGRTSQLAIAAASLGLKDAKLSDREISGEKSGVIIGTTIGEKSIEELAKMWAKDGLNNLNRAKIFQVSANNIPGNVGIHFKARGLNFLIPTACAAGNYSIGYGADLIRNGDLNFVLAGGSEAFSHVAFAGFQRLYSMAPEKCQPFDKNRKGIILGEGAGILVLESLESAIKREAEIYAEILGYGLSCDAYHITAPNPKGVAKVMKKALADSGLSAKDVDYICAHGTGTLINDKTETKAIKNVFGQWSENIFVSSIKSMLGHTMGAASAIEAAVCCLVIKHSIVPPTINYETPDPECGIDCVPNKARKKKVKVALNNAFAFGGNNCCVAFGDADTRG